MNLVMNEKKGRELGVV